MSELFVEKYRPTKFEDIISPPAGTENLVKNADIPHLLFLGKAGCGKTTLAYVIAKHFGLPCMIVNASDERGIDTIREKVKQFAMVKGRRICILDEADFLTKEAQATFRHTLEAYVDCRFILTANYSGKIIDPIKSRCMVVEFTTPKYEDILKRLEYICKTENIKYTEDVLKKILDITFPDIRNAINTLQFSVDESVNEIRQVKKVLNDVGEFIFIAIANKKWTALREFIRSIPLDYDLVYQYLFNKYFDSDVKNKEKVLIDIADRMYKNNSISDSFINLMACCMEISGSING